VPLLEEGGVEAFFRREVLPHAADAWINVTVSAPAREALFVEVVDLIHRARQRAFQSASTSAAS
jgi:hypothetical protein